MLKPVILSASILALTLSLAPVKDASAYWGTYQHDAQQTGKADKAAPSAPSVKWSYQHPNVVDPIAGWVYDPAFVAGVAEGADGTIYAAGADGRAYAFDSNGSVKHILDGIGVCCAPPVVGQDGTIYFAGNGLWALNPDFTVRFYFPDGDTCCGAITVGADGTILLGKGVLYAFDPANLNFTDPTNADPLIAKTVSAKWLYDQREVRWASSTSTDGKTLYVAGPLFLVAIETATGKELWYQDIKNERETMPVVKAVTGKGDVVFIAADQKIIAIDTAMIGINDKTPPPAAVSTVISFSGMQVDRIAFDATTAIDGSGTIAAMVLPFTLDASGVKVFDFSGTTDLYSINAKTGALRWKTTLPGMTDAATPIFDATGAIIVNSDEMVDGVDFTSHLYMYSTAGVKVWEYTVANIYQTDARVPIIGMDGTLYTLINGALKAFGGTADLSVSLAATPSPAKTKSTVTYTMTVTNNGPSSAVQPKLNQSFDKTLTNFVVTSNNPITPECQLNTRSIACTFADLAPGSSKIVTVTATTAGTASTLVTNASVKAGSVDLNLANNTATISTPVVAPVTCDLIISAVSGPTAITRGTTKYSFTATVKNQGTGSCAASTTGFYLSPTITAAVTQVGTIATSALAAGATQSLTLSTAVATTKLAAGTFYVGAVADSAAVVAETLETNNFKSVATTVKTTVK